MQTGNAHQVDDAGAQKHLPILRRNRAIVADHQCQQHAPITRVAQHLAEALADLLAQVLDQVSRTVDQSLQPDVIRTVAHIAGGADVTLQRPGLEVETVRIVAAVRLFQPYRQPPALAGVEFRYSLAPRGRGLG